jgi:hypothetical protein
VRVEGEGELDGEVVILVVDEAVDGEVALNDEWTASGRVSAIVDSDTGPSTLTRGAHRSSTSGVILEDLGGTAVGDPFKNVESFPVYRFYSRIR